MIFCKERKIAFFLPPRTGSASLIYILSNVGFSITAYRHIFYSKALEIYPQLSNYKLYGFFRNPEDRFVSAIKACERTKTENIREVFNNYIFLFNPQTNFLVQPHVTVLDFDNYEDELVKVVGDSVKGCSAIRANESTSKDFVRSKELKFYVQQAYAADYEIGMKVLGKRYDI